MKIQWLVILINVGFPHLEIILFWRAVFPVIFHHLLTLLLFHNLTSLKFKTAPMIIQTMAQITTCNVKGPPAASGSGDPPSLSSTDML